MSRRIHASAGACLLSLLVAGCGGESDPPAPPEEQPISITDPNNYQASSDIRIPTVETAPATDLEICWDDLTSDIQCHDVDPVADIDNVGLLRMLNLTEDDVEAKLEEDQLEQSHVSGYVEHRTDHESACAVLSAFDFFGTTVNIEEEYVVNENQTYMLLFATGIQAGVGARHMTFIKPTEGSDNTVVNIEPGCGALDFMPDIAGAEPLAVPLTGPWVLDWRKLTRNGLGNPVPATGIDSALVGFYAGQTVAELEADIFDLELNATELFEVDLKGTRKVELSTMLERTSQEPFSGFERSEEGVWLFGLRCSGCKNPAPIVLTVLSPGAEET
jgi:hypothetical protein